MCEVLLRIVDKVNADSEIANARCSKAGDVIAVCPDDWKWGREELAHPEWVVVKLPGVPVTALADMTQPELSQTGELLRKRARRIDLTAPGLQGALASGGAVTLRSVALRKAFIAAKHTKGPFVAPIVLS